MDDPDLEERMSAVASMPVDLPTFNVETLPDGTLRVSLVGAWHFAALEPRLAGMNRSLFYLAAVPDIQWDLQHVETLDVTGAAILWGHWTRRLDRVRLRPEHEALFDRLARTPPPVPPPRPPWTEALVVLGSRMAELSGHLLGMLVILGRLILDLAYVVSHPSRAPWREWSAGIYRAGVTALPITALVGFLIGIVLSYLSAQQLRTFGANVFIVNLLGISILRELGPLLAAILVAGRSGSAITAQIGMMRVTKELDALAVLGISASLRLVLPRVLALACAMPLLVVWTDALALWGGMIAADRELGIPPSLFFAKLPDVVPVSNLWLGVSKGAVFGVLIGLIACHFGLRVEPNTQSLGAGTTRSVVASITAVILADALFAIMTSRGWFG
jgi:phospholipid/cholesterol/gamma-HCH transport system permease protein